MSYVPAWALFDQIETNPLAQNSIGFDLVAGNVASSLTSTTLTANSVAFCPLYILRAVTVTKLWWINGAGTINGSVDCGIYDENGNHIVSTGSVTQAGTNTAQTTDVTDTRLQRGTYYMALVNDSATGTFTVISATAYWWQGYGCVLMGSVTLPLSSGANPATFATYTRAALPLMGAQIDRTFGP